MTKQWWQAAPWTLGPLNMDDQMQHAPVSLQYKKITSLFPVHDHIACHHHISPLTNVIYLYP